MSRALRKALLIAGVALVSLWVLTPIYLLLASSLAGRLGVNAWPKPLFPAAPTLEVLQFFFRVEGVWKATLVSLQVAAMTMLFSLLLGAPRAMRSPATPSPARTPSASWCCSRAPSPSQSSPCR